MKISYHSRNILRKPKSLITINRRFYERMSTEEYLINSRKAFTNQ